MGDSLCFLFNDHMNFAGASAIQEVVPSDASTLFSLSVFGETIAADLSALPTLTAASSADEVTRALEALHGVGTGGVTVRTRAYQPDGGWVVTFNAACRLCGGDVPLIAATPAGSVTTSETRSGVLVPSEKVKLETKHYCQC